MLFHPVCGELRRHATRRIPQVRRGVSLVGTITRTVVRQLGPCGTCVELGAIHGLREVSITSQ